MSAEAAIQILSTRCDELLDMVAERDRTIALQVKLIESQDKHPLPKIEPGDIDRIAELAQILRSGRGRPSRGQPPSGRPAKGP